MSKGENRFNLKKYDLAELKESTSKDSSYAEYKRKVIEAHEEYLRRKENPDSKIVSTKKTTFPALMFKEYDDFVKALPRSVVVRHGCLSCDWKSNNMCPFGFRKGLGFKIEDNCHANGICLERASYLASFVDFDSKQKCTYARWRRNFLLGEELVKGKEKSVELKKIEKKLKSLMNQELTSKDDRQKLNILMKEADRLRGEWHSLWRTIVEYDDRQISRESPKKIEIDEKKLTASDIHAIMKEGAIDAEVVKD